MEKERKITAPDGCEIEKVEIVDGAAVVTFREKKRKLPKSWDEFCEMFPMKIPYNFGIKKQDLYSDDVVFLQSYNNRLIEEMGKFTGNYIIADAVLALCQLIQLRNCYNGDWVPDWTDDNSIKYVLDFHQGCVSSIKYTIASSPLYFKTEELRDEFLKYFRPLIEKLKPLYGINEGGEE